MTYAGPDRRNGTSLEKVHDAIVKNQEKLEEVREEQVATSTRLEAIQDGLRRGEQRFDRHDERIRKNSEGIVGAKTEIGNLKTDARKSGGVAGGATGGLAGGIISIAWQFLKDAFKGG